MIRILRNDNLLIDQTLVVRVQQHIGRPVAQRGLARSHDLTARVERRDAEAHGLGERLGHAA